MQSLVSLLEQTWARLESFLDPGSAPPPLRAVLADPAMGEALALGLGVFLAVVLVGKVLPRRDRRSEAEILRERVRELELKLEAARGEMATARRVQQDLQKGDPRVFAAALATAIAEDGPKAHGLAPEAWLAPLRPALADAYLGMAREILGKAGGEGDLALARRMAQGAMAAEPGRADCAELLSRIDEAQRLGLFSELSEADALAWRIARNGADDLARQRARGLVARSSGQIGYSVLISGWEAEDLHDAALAALAGSNLAEAFEAEPEGAGAETPAASESPAPRRGAAGDCARVVPLTAGAAGRDAGLVDDVEEIRAVGAGGRGSTVLVMPRGRAGGREALDILRGGADRDGRDGASGGGSDRGAEFRRLWERRRRPDMLGETHPRTLAARANMGYVACREGRHAEAEAICREVLAALAGTDVTGEHRSEVLAVQHNLGVALLRQGRLDEAEAEFRELVETLGSPRDRGRGEPLAMAAAHGLGEVANARGRHAEAEAAFAVAWRARCADPALGPDHPNTLWSRARMLRAAAVAPAAAG